MGIGGTANRGIAVLSFVTTPFNSSIKITVELRCFRTFIGGEVNGSYGPGAIKNLAKAVGLGRHAAACLPRAHS